MGRADAVGAQHDLVERLAAAHPHVHGGRRGRGDLRRRDRPVGRAHGDAADRSAASTASTPGPPASSARPRPPQQGERLGPAGGPHGRRRRRAGHRRPPRPRGRARPARSRSLDARRRATTRSDARAVGTACPPATGGPLRARAARRPRGRAPPAPGGRGRRPAPRAAAGAIDADLAAEGAAVGQRGRRLAARLAPRRVDLEVGRARPRSCAASPPSRPRGTSSGCRSSAVVRRPCTLPAAARASASVSPTAHPPAPSGTATSASAGALVVGEPAVAERDVGADPLRRRRPRSSARRPRPRGHGRRPRGGARRPPVRSAQASRIVRQPVHRHRWASSACSTAAASSGPAPLAAQAGQPHHDARACRTRTGWRRWRRTPRPTPRARPRRARRAWSRDRPAHPPDRRHARHPWLRRRPARCSTRTGPAGCSRPSPSAARAARAAPRAAWRPSSGTSTGPPVDGQADRRALGGHPARIGTGAAAVRRRRWRRSARRGRPRRGAPATRPGSTRCSPRAAPSTARAGSTVVSDTS